MRVAHTYKSLLLVMMTLFLIRTGRANNLQITNEKLVDSSHVRITVSWDNSWRFDTSHAIGNYDAVWLFLKYRNARDRWTHLEVDSDSQAYTFNPSGMLNVQPAANKTGFFLYRSDTGTGDISPTDLTIPLDTSFAEGHYGIRIYGIEMVHIPKGPFQLGDTTSYYTFRRSDTLLPYRVRSDSMIPVGDTIMGLGDNYQDSPAHNIPSSYPKGYRPFYCMKYEITQEQYVDFLNTLTYAQQDNHTAVTPDRSVGTYAMTSGGGKRNAIVIREPGTSGEQRAQYGCQVDTSNGIGQYGDGQTRAANFLNWSDVAAYLDWAGLRPMTEFEFEKACRGSQSYVPHEFAWGTDKAIAGLTMVNDGTPIERVEEQSVADSGLANFRWNSLGDDVQGPFRAGFGSSDTSDRLQSGAGYYGVFELSGNVWEYCVNVDSSGLAFSGNNGDGLLDPSGFYNEPAWPGQNKKGVGHRGGAWNSSVYFLDYRDLAVSDRYYIDLFPDQRRATGGGRGVRSVPK